MTNTTRCLITGATNGIGKATAMEMAGRGYEMVLLGRSEAKLQAVKDWISEASGNSAIQYLCADLASMADVRRVADEYLSLDDRPLECFISNAGVTNRKQVITVDGFEEMFAVNHLAPFLLCNLLLERIKASAPARIVVVASGAHAFHKGINFDDLRFDTGFSALKVYGHSKLANMLFTHELAKRLRGSGVTVNACHPGAVATGLGTNNGMLGKVIMGALKPFFRTPEKGAETSVYLACDEQLATSSGGYYYNCRPAKPKPWAVDDAAAERLWAVSERLLGMTETNQ